MSGLSASGVVTIVSGLPRSGTSLMMQMIEAGGIESLRDGVRTPDEDNPRGYHEFERVKQIKTDKAWLADAVGKVVKMVHLLLLDLPEGYTYRVVFMRRDLEEVLASQKKMLERSGKSGAALPGAALMGVYKQQIDRVLSWMRERPSFSVMEVSYAEVVADPSRAAGEINRFLGGTLDEDAMAGAVDPSLYRNRKA